MQYSQYQPFTKRVLVIGRYELQLASALNFLYESGFDSMGALKDEEALRLFEELDPHILIIADNVDDASKAFFKEHFLEINPTLTILELSGGVLALKLLIQDYTNI